MEDGRQRGDDGDVGFEPQKFWYGWFRKKKRFSLTDTESIGEPNPAIMKLDSSLSLSGLASILIHHDKSSSLLSGEDREYFLVVA